MRDTAIAVLSGLFIVLNTYIRKEEMTQTNNLIFHLKKFLKKNRAN